MPRQEEKEFFTHACGVILYSNVDFYTTLALYHNLPHIARDWAEFCSYCTNIMPIHLDISHKFCSQCQVKKFLVLFIEIWETGWFFPPEKVVFATISSPVFDHVTGSFLFCNKKTPLLRLPVEAVFLTLQKSLLQQGVFRKHPRSWCPL